MQNEGLVTFTCGKWTVLDRSGCRDKYHALGDSCACVHAVTSVIRAITTLTSEMFFQFKYSVLRCLKQSMMFGAEEVRKERKHY